jgi:uncharacterized membrane protein YjjP (DUF1212 family)
VASDPPVEFLVQLAEALTRAGEPEGLVQPRVDRMAVAYGVPSASVVLLPKLTLAAAAPGEPVALDATAPTEWDLRLDQMAAVARVARLADSASVDPDDGMRALDDAAALPHRFGPVGIVAGHATISLGACLILQPTPMVLPASALLGALVGVLRLRARTALTLRVLLPIVAAAVVTLLAFALDPGKTTQESLRALIPPLITFLPGGLITSATLDLVVGHQISGATRLVAGSMQLVLLALGIALGAATVGADLGATTANTPINTISPWAPWLGAIVFGVGSYIHYSGPPGSLRWLLVVLLAAWTGERAGATLLSPQLGAVVGAFVMTPVAAWVERRPSAPPALATITPAFRLLVPGAVSFIGVAQFFGSRQDAGIGHMVDALVAFILIGIGVFVGQALVLRVRSGRRPDSPTGPSARCMSVASHRDGSAHSGRAGQAARAG